MALQILSSSPNSNSVNQPIDSTIQLEFSQAVDPFSIPKGISIYSIGATNLKGPLAAELDINTSDVNAKYDNINNVEYSYSMSGNLLTIIPTFPLERNTKYYIQVVPGSSPLRFLSTETTSNIVYTTAASGTELNITSSYTGKEIGTYSLIFSSPTEFDLSFEGIYKDSYTFQPGIELTIDKSVIISLTGNFVNGDKIEFDVTPASGVLEVYKISFTTSNYETAPVLSTRIEDVLYRQFINDFKIVSISPPSFSVNNTRCNPIIIKFNKPISPTQNFANKIKIHKLNMNTGSIKKVVNYTKIAGDTLKIFLVSVDSASEISESLAYEINSDPKDLISKYNIIYNG